MTFKICSTRGISERPIIVEIVEKIKTNPFVFKVISRVFATYNNNNIPIQEIEIYVNETVNLPRFNLCMTLKQEISNCLLSIYDLDNNQFNRIRSEILENVVFEFGPCIRYINRDKVYIEPIIKDNEYLIGESDIKCDFVFFSHLSCPLVFIECKTEIGNIIPRNLSFNRLKKSHQKKIRYLNSAYSYIKKTYIKPYIYFACYNHNYKLELRNLQINMGYKQMDFLSPKEIIYGKL